MWPQRPRRMGTSPWRTLGGPWSRSVGSPAGRCSCDRGVAEACRSGLLGKLMAEVRSEFRSDILEFGAEDPVFGGAECRVVGYARTARGRGLWEGHRQRWHDEGCPSLEWFVASTT